MVNNFSDLRPSGNWGPLESSGRVGLKDQLFAINGVDITGLSFNDVEKIIRKDIKKGSIRLRFGRLTQGEERFMFCVILFVSFIPLILVSF